MIHALLLATAARFAMDAPRCKTPVRYASVRVVSGMPFVKPLKPGLLITVKKTRGGGYEIFNRAFRNNSLAIIQFRPDGSVTITGNIVSDPNSGTFYVVGPPPCHSGSGYVMPSG